MARPAASFTKRSTPCAQLSFTQFYLHYTYTTVLPSHFAHTSALPWLCSTVCAAHALRLSTFAACAFQVRMLVDLQECSIPADELPTNASEYAKVFTPTRAQLAADTRALLDELGGSARATLGRLEKNLADHKSGVHQAKAESEKALMLSRTQREALEVGNEKRLAFLAEKQRQLEVEEKEVHRERNALLNRKHTVEALQHEIEYVEGVVANRKEASVAAAAARVAAAGALRKYKLGAKLKEAAIKASTPPTSHSLPACPLAGP